MIPSRILLWKFFSFSFILSLFVYLPALFIASAEARIEGKKNVLILDSYHEGFKGPETFHKIPNELVGMTIFGIASLGGVIIMLLRSSTFIYDK